MKTLTVVTCMALSLMTGTILASEHAEAAAKPKILIIGNDAGPNMPRRGQPIFRSVGDTLSEWLNENGYRVFSERHLSTEREQSRKRIATKDIVYAAKSLNRNMDAVVVYSVNRNTRLHDGERFVQVRLQAQLINLPSGLVIDTITLKGRDSEPLPGRCSPRCRNNIAYDLAQHIAPQFAEETVTRMQQTDWRTKSKAKVKYTNGNTPNNMQGYAIVLKDFRPAELKRMMRILHRHEDRMDVWTVKDSRDSRILWVEVAAQPRKVRKALKRLLATAGVKGEISKTERGFAIVRIGRTPSQVSVLSMN